MANLGFELNVNEAVKDYKAGFELIPPGIYPVVIIDSVEQRASTGGKMIVLTYELQDGSKRIIKDRLNTVHAEENTQKKARSTLAKIADVIGNKGILTNTDVLHGRPFMVKIIIEESESKTEKGKMFKNNKVTEYLAKGKISAVEPAASSNPAW